eukprot:CAMPEP_0177168880 /NCGR_PEP_ID=MMETSP0367-20130122/9291_1 /TAXON_ID=447022 ORGANISM="Scrippsiella hangoei-like, Strain SHHI-4" /NCGR_SAMPLE_ID=MMETSP0367 /ASSEMBLY_ACC=CAM_ASM_000362 /LENGTH=383 /DNA_ID=CAMNT_0018615021 /DNA_START=41 /DNA_END=1188 /DNA_ORIENTATION=+
MAGGLAGALPPWVVPFVAQMLLFTLLVGMAASVDTKALRERFRRCCGVFFGLAFQFFLLPFIGYLTVSILDLKPVYGISLLAVTASPGGAYSNWWCSIFNADLALSIAMTTCSTVASVVMTPVNLYMYMSIKYGKVPSLNFGRLVGSIAVAVAAIFTGLGISLYFPGKRQLANKLGNMAGIFLMVFSAIVSSGGDQPLWDKEPSFYLATILPCLLALTVSFALGWLAPCLSAPEAVAVTVETCYQNTGLALTIALASFDGPERSEAASVPLFYGIVQVAILPLFLFVAWKCGLTYAPADATFAKVICQSWQPLGGPQVAVETASTDGVESETKDDDSRLGDASLAQIASKGEDSMADVESGAFLTVVPTDSDQDDDKDRQPMS